MDLRPKYIFIIEKAGNNLCGWFPDVLGCVTTGDTFEEIQKNAVEALELHLFEIVDDFTPASSLEEIAPLTNKSQILCWI